MQIDLFKKEEIGKADILFITDQLKNKVDNGDINPLLLKQKLKALSTIIENADKSFLSKACVDEAAKYPEKSFNLFGAEFSKGEFGTKYDYSKCGDPVLEKLNKNFLDAKASLEKRQNFLKSISSHETVVDEDSGEIVTVYPPVKTSTSGVACSIK